MSEALIWLLAACMFAAQTAIFVVVFYGTNFRDRWWQIPLVGKYGPYGYGNSKNIKKPVEVKDA